MTTANKFPATAWGIFFEQCDIIRGDKIFGGIEHEYLGRSSSSAPANYLA